MIYFEYQYDKSKPKICVSSDNVDMNIESLVEMFESFALAAGYSSFKLEIIQSDPE